MSSDNVRGPTDKQRTIIIGRTGSGKSQFGIGMLSTRNFHQIPWIMIDYKGEDLWEDIRDATGNAIKDIKPTDNPPTKPGLYHLRPLPKVDDEAMEGFLWKVHKNGKTGLFLDEGYALPQKNAFDVILTQGRTLRIPVICLYQRPVWMTRFAVAQADFVAVFAQMDKRDKISTSQFVMSVKGPNGEITVFDDLPPYHCIWYDVGQGKSHILTPAPSRELIIEEFVKRLTRKRAGVLV